MCSSDLSFKNSSLVCDKPFQVVYSDVWGPAPVNSIDGFRYYIIFVDYFTKYTWFFPLKLKSDVPTVFEQFKNLIENFFDAKIKTVYSDGGGEYQALSHTLKRFGIQHLTSPPYTPEHVGSAERKHRHIVETGLTLLHTASAPIKFWSYAFQSATYLINRMPTPTLKNNTPYHTLFHHHPSYTSLRVFGCLYYPWLRPYTAHKLEPRSRPCVFLGYSVKHHAFQCFDFQSSKTFISRHVVFFEGHFPF